MIIFKSILIIIANLIIYAVLGSLVFCKKKDGNINLGLYIITGFFLYYIIFFVVCLPFMIKYRPLTWFIKAFVVIIVCFSLSSAITNFKILREAFLDFISIIKKHPYAAMLLSLVIFIQIILVTTTYNFTLDAAYYVANVTTSLETNMINVYDPFTGSWLDHYEVRYIFATYSINDAVVCFLTGIPALVQTKLVMSATIIILVNILYIMIAAYLFDGTDNSYFVKRNKTESPNTSEFSLKKVPGISKIVAMVYIIFFINCTFNTIYTSSLFLLTRTYEGKTVVGNLSLLIIFYLFMLMINDEEISKPWLVIFLVSLGSMTISSSANMLIPAELTLLFVSYMFIKKSIKILPKYIAAMLPGICMLSVYILYIEGYFVLYTYPR